MQHTKSLTKDLLRFGYKPTAEDAGNTWLYPEINGLLLDARRCPASLEQMAINATRHRIYEENDFSNIKRKINTIREIPRGLLDKFL